MGSFRGEMLNELKLLKTVAQQAHTEQLLTTQAGTSMMAKMPGPARWRKVAFPLAQMGLDEDSGQMLSGKLWAVCCGI